MSVRVLLVSALHRIEIECADADAVAAYLRRRRVSGLRANACACPLAIWLRRVTTLADVRVQPDRVEFWVRDRRVTIVDLPRVVAQFEVAFDRGDYPQLAVR